MKEQVNFSETNLPIECCRLTRIKASDCSTRCPGYSRRLSLAPTSKDKWEKEMEEGVLV